MVGSSLLNTFGDQNVANTDIQNDVAIEDRPSDPFRESGDSQSMTVIGTLLYQLPPLNTPLLRVF